MLKDYFDRILPERATTHEKLFARLTVALESGDTSALQPIAGGIIAVARTSPRLEECPTRERRPLLARLRITPACRPVTRGELPPSHRYQTSTPKARSSGTRGIIRRGPS